jgi:kinetochore protein Nuf2
MATFEASFMARAGTGNNLNQSTMNPKGFLFPRLPPSEIIKCLTELGVPISKEALTRPEDHRETIQTLLEYLAETLLGLNREELSQPAFSGLEAIVYPQLHEESIPHINSIRAISKLMEICEINDFTIKDILNPTASRLLRQLSGIMNFAKFREERLQLLFELNQSTQTLLDQLQASATRNDQLNSRLSALREQSTEEIKLLNTLDQDCNDFKTRIENIHRDTVAFDNSISQANEKISQLENTTVEYYQQLEELSSLQHRLSTQVVSSPEKFRKQIIEVGQTLQHEQKDAKAAEKRVKELSAWLVNVEEAQNEVLAALECIQEVRAEVEKQKTMISELDAQKQNVNVVRLVLSELNQNAQQHHRQSTRAEEKVTQLRKLSNTRIEESQQTIEELHKKLVEAESFRVQIRGKAERIESEASKLEREIDAENISHQQVMMTTAIVQT